MARYVPAEWDGLGEDWLEQALAYAVVPCKGVRGPLTRIRPRPARHAARNGGDQPGSMAAAAGPLYRLADYLDQHGRAHRASQIPPAEFWSAAAAHAAPGDQAALGDAAHARGLYRDAAQLHKNAAASGNPRAALYLSHPPACHSSLATAAGWSRAVWAAARLASAAACSCAPAFRRLSSSQATTCGRSTWTCGVTGGRSAATEECAALPGLTLAAVVAW